VESYLKRYNKKRTDLDLFRPVLTVGRIAEGKKFESPLDSNYSNRPMNTYEYYDTIDNDNFKV